MKHQEMLTCMLSSSESASLSSCSAPASSSRSGSSCSSEGRAGSALPGSLPDSQVLLSRPSPARSRTSSSQSDDGDEEQTEEEELPCQLSPESDDEDEDDAGTSGTAEALREVEASAAAAALRGFFRPGRKGWLRRACPRLRLVLPGHARGLPPYAHQGVMSSEGGSTCMHFQHIYLLSF